MHLEINTVNKRDMYRLPWSANDNPEGRVEITDTCNLKCAGSWQQRKVGHKQLDSIRKEVFLLRQSRNCGRISIVGGEPSLHPHIVEIVRFVSEHGMQPFLHSNGHTLSRDLLGSLARAGLRGVELHIDVGQNRPGWENASEMELCGLRERLADMVSSARGLSCSFKVIVRKENLAAIPHLVQWAIRNDRKVQGFTFIAPRTPVVKPANVYRVDDCNLPTGSGSGNDAPSHIAVEGREITCPEVDRVIREKIPAYRPAAYVGGMREDASHRYIASTLLCCDGRALGSSGKRSEEIAHVAHHLLSGTYPTGLRKAPSRRGLLLLALLDKRLWGVLGGCMLRPWLVFQQLQSVRICITEANDLFAPVEEGLCEGCASVGLRTHQAAFSRMLERRTKRPAGTIGGAMGISRPTVREYA